MVSDQEIAKSVETLLRESNPNAVASFDGFVRQLEAKLGLDLSHKAGFIRDQISILLRSQVPPQLPPSPPKDHFSLQHPPQLQQQHFPSHFAIHTLPQQLRNDLNVYQNPPRPQQPQPPLRQAPPQEPAARNVPAEMPKESAVSGVKRRGGPGGLNKVCGVTPELQAVVGEPALPRTEIVKKLWAYIRKYNLQDPSNKRKIICDDALRLLFETDCTDMFKMNKLLAKHIIPIDCTKSDPAKRLKVDVESITESTKPSQSPVLISEALAKFMGIDARKMLQSEAEERVWEYIKVNRLEDPINSMVILCDEKLSSLLGCESISALGVREMLKRQHLFQCADA